MKVAGIHGTQWRKVKEMAKALAKLESEMNARLNRDLLTASRAETCFGYNKVVPTKCRVSSGSVADGTFG